MLSFLPDVEKADRKAKLLVNRMTDGRVMIAMVNYYRGSNDLTFEIRDAAVVDEEDLMHALGVDTRD